MKKVMLVGLVVLMQVVAFAQGKYDANWCFGVKAGIDFRDTSNPVNFNTLCNNDVSAASISDSLGNLMFYLAPDTPFAPLTMFNTNYAFFNGNNAIIANGSGIKVQSRMNNEIILSFGNTYRVFYFVDSVSFSQNSLYTTTITKTDSLGLAVVKKNQLVSALLCEYGLTATKHANGIDWWILMHSSIANDSSFYEYLVKQDTILGPITIPIGTPHVNPNYQFGQMAFSVDGNKLAVVISAQNMAEVFDFDRCTGAITNPNQLVGIDDKNIVPNVIGCQFSLSGRLLYISEGIGDASNGRNGLYQYDLDAPDINSTRIVLWQDSDFTLFSYGFLQRAPNDKIYLAAEGGNSAPYYNSFTQYNQNLSVINYPDSIGLACNFQPFSYYLGDSARAYDGLPNMPNYNLGQISVYAANAGQDVTLCKDTAENVTLGVPAVPNIIYHWQPSDGLSDTSIAQPTASPDTDTYYILTVTDTSQSNNACNTRMDTVFVHVIQKCGVGIDEVSEQPIKVYPNPASTQLVVECLSDFGQQIPDNRFIVYDLMGRVVIEKRINDSKTLVDVSNIPNGLYIYKVGERVGKVQVVR